ncbi:pectate lyase, partial [Candidatus Endoriftia persephone str. Guaymas]|nr:pectate lyase [Candidatus Endoriftia persephone str. Guaymas]
ISSSRFRIVVDAGTSTSTALSVDASGVGLATLGTAYSANITGSGGEGNYSWSLSGTLPAGLSWAEAADNLSIDITGTPTQAGQFQFAVNLQTAGDSVSETLSITVVETIEPVALTTSSVPAATKDSAYSTTLQASGGVAPFSWSISSGTLPAGLSLD